MKLPTIIWTTTGLIIFVAVASQTNIIKNLINKVKNPPHGFYDPCGFDPITDLQNMQQQPNFTQPLVSPDINKEIESQEPRHRKTHKSESEAHAQIECPDDPNTLPCGSNCYSNGQLWKTVCSEDETQALFPPARDNNIHPTTPDQNQEYQYSQYNPNLPSYQQQRPPPPPTPSTTTTTPPVPSDNVLCTLTPDTDKRVYDRGGDPAGGCYKGNTGTTCRFQNCSTSLPVGQNYGVYGNIITGSGGELSGHGGAGIEITSGGPGSENGNCCGVTVMIKEDGYFKIATEDWTGPSGKHQYLCSDKPGSSESHLGCGANGAKQGKQSTQLFNNPGIPFSWHVDYTTYPGHIVYCGRLDGKAGCGPGYIGQVTDPRTHGQKLIANRFIQADNPTSDGTRIRGDGLGTNFRVRNGRVMLE
jgi:hypothetical protein